MNTRARSARQLEAVIVGCIKSSAESAEKYTYISDYSAADRRTANFVACLCGALEARGYPELAKAFATGAGMEHLYPAEKA